MSTTATLSFDAANDLLKGCGFEGRFTEGQFSLALKQHTPKRIRDAIQRAGSDAGARRFVENLFAPVSDEQPPAARSETQSEAPPTSSSTSSEDRSSEPSDGRKIPLTFKVYGGKGALEFREHISTKDVPTVMLEGASARGQRQYDWRNKVSVQVMPRELPAVAAVLAGLMPKCEFKNHGPEKNKGYSIELQKGGYFVKVSQSGDNHRLIAVPMPPEEAYYVNSLVLRQLARITPGCDGVLVLAAIRAYAKAAETL
jgi:Whirly transcription factor